MRRRIYEIIEAATEDDKLSNVYDIFMMIVITASLVPLTVKEETEFFYWLDKIAVIIFIIDYLLRCMTADFKLKRGAVSFLVYPVTPMALIDLLCILPSLSLISGGFRALKVFRLLRTFRVFKAIRYSKSVTMVREVFEKQKRPLITVCILAVIYILIAAMIVFNIEPESFDNYFNAVYWAAISLTSIGYGDIYPVTTIGKMVTIVSSIFGIAIIALPSGIITAGFLEELKNHNEDI